MLSTAVALWQVALAIHIAAVVVAFGVTFAYPLIDAIGTRLDARAMPWYYRVRLAIGQRVVSPGLAVVILAGIYLASKLHQWHAFYVQWGLGVAVLIGAVGGVILGPAERKLAELAERDLADSDGRAEVAWSPAYATLRRRVARVGGAISLLVLVTIYLMSVRAGA